MTALQLEVAETVALISAEAVELGHDPHPWGASPFELEQRTACRRCGALLRVSVSAGAVRVIAPAERCSR